MLRVLREVWHTLDRSRAGADNSHFFVCQLVQISGGIAARVSVIPSAGVESVPLEAVDARKSGKLRPVKRPVGHDDEARSHPVVAIGGYYPAVLLFVPSDVLDLSLKAGVTIQVEFLADASRVSQDLRRVGVLLLRDVAGLFEQRQIDVSLDIALRTRISIPVPGPAEVAALLDDAEVLDAGLFQTRGCEQTAEAAADDQNFDIVVQRFSGEARVHIRIVDITFEVAFHFDVLLIAVLANAFVPLLAVLVAKSIGVEIELLATVAGRQTVGIVTHR